ncbi:phenazine biosynthesis protein PhzF family [Desulfovibrio sp. X2]|uniref:PhzF family isomerase n=1 Tax=Desulfovibrio sp. X2 TaxID=941449 RepID=UPI00035888AA|nr:PhzF family isomerase [Desulfovibrio sp. X2]EPR37175.1 phenazine biosynthesis protein PhzF family [Desulfovibrio sp. X2]
MNKEITVLLVDAFTAVPGKGNRAGVVLDALGLDAREMQAVAALVNVSETAFMLPVAQPAEYELRVRYFTPTTEVPSCGHATIASHFARSEALGIESGRVVAKIGAGILPVDITGTNGRKKIVMTQGAVAFTPPYDSPTRAAILAALGLREDDLVPDLPVQEVSTGHSKVMVPIRSVRTLDALAPDMAALVAVSRKTGCNGYFVFAMNGPDDPCLTSGRMFAPISGIDEDPVTGNGNGPCGAYLSRYGILPDAPRTAYCGRQGVAMGKEGVVEVVVHRADGRPVTIQVAGTAVKAGEMRVRLSHDAQGAVRAETC